MVKIFTWMYFIGCLAWLYAERDYEPALASIAGAISLIILYTNDHQKKKSRRVSQLQTVSDDAVGIQAGGNINYSHSSSSKINENV